MIAPQPAPASPPPADPVPAPPQAPTLPTPIAAVPIPVTGVPRTVQELQDLRSRREELSDQLQSVASRRNAIAGRLRNATGPDRVGLEQRLQLLDQRILQLETDIAITGQQIAATPAQLRGRASVSVPPRGRDDFRERGALAIGSLFTILVLAPLAFATARNLWRRGSHAPHRDPESAQRLIRLEAAVDTIAVEMERVSEGQRFLTRLLAESNGVARLDALPQRDADLARAASATPTTEIRVDPA